MALSTTAHLDSLLKHIDLVRGNCLYLGKKFIEEGRVRFGRDMIARGFRHDLSKLENQDEWKYLHVGKDVPKDKLMMAVESHRLRNDHHVEYWGSIKKMPEICLCEMICDVFSRCQEFGENFREWVEENVIKKYKLSQESKHYKWINKFVEMLVFNSFVK